MKGLADKIGDERGTEVENLIGEAIKAKSRVSQAQKKTNNAIQRRKKMRREGEEVGSGVMPKDNLGWRREKGTGAPDRMSVGVKEPVHGEGIIQWITLCL